MDRQDSAERLWQPRVLEIPSELHSIYTGQPFDKCLVCETQFGRAGIYQIHKAWRGSECIMEAAICVTCLREMSREYSDESMVVVRRYQARALAVLGKDSCGFCVGPAGAFDAFSKVAVCQGGSLIRPVVFLCSGCEEEVHEALSQRTRDVHDDFMRDHFPGLPVDLEFVPRV